MATQVLPIANTEVSAEFTLSVPTLVWIHGTGALNTHAGWEPSAAAWAIWEEQA